MTYTPDAVIVFLLCVGGLGVLPGEAAPSAQRPCYRVYGDTFTRAGKTVTMDCELDGDPPFVFRPPSYQWFKDGEVIPGQSSRRLALHSVTRQDAGNYQCGPSSSDVDRKGLDLHVFFPGDVVSRPEIVKQQDSLAVCGRPYSLRCIFHRDVHYVVSRDTVFTWYKDSAEVKGQSGEVLMLHNVTEADGGLYRCTAREGPVESTSPPSTDYDLIVLLPPQVGIKPSGPVVKGILGESLTLTCEVTRAFPKVPADGYSWSYLPFPHESQRPLEGKAKTLTLGPLTREDRGQYFCQARNDQLFQITKMSGDASVTVDVVYLENITLTPDLKVNRGDTVTLTCVVDSHPTARLAWTVNGQEVRHVTDNLDHYVIMSAACSDSTNYTCGASNTELPGRERHATTRVHVHCTQDRMCCGDWGYWDRATNTCKSCQQLCFMAAQQGTGTTCKDLCGHIFNSTEIKEGSPMTTPTISISGSFAETLVVVVVVLVLALAMMLHCFKIRRRCNQISGDPENNRTPLIESSSPGATPPRSGSAP